MSGRRGNQALQAHGLSLTARLIAGASVWQADLGLQPADVMTLCDYTLR